ncbi:uncharacterized protein UTRI_06061 [Ustilago trichophora]|uniref:Zn(2)-C6 fungal-type domain-containing protein n=1 Tax=Ustilago trichophora TaxID=86804 RepID=A0A5C3EFB1_9BASI|nr:uncharacterized protein UTRI_06061 [Ustilago trichophora]
MPADRNTSHGDAAVAAAAADNTSDPHDKSSKKQTARRRAYAKRSCLKCREKKARCELPQQSLTTPSSMTPLSNHLACHRCKVLSLDCVVWDGDRKRRPKLSSTNLEQESSADPPSTSRLPSSPPRSPGSLEQLAAAAAHLSDQRSHLDDASDMSPHAAASSNDAASSREAASTLASVQFFNPVVEDVSTPTSLPSPASFRAPDPSYLSAASPTDLKPTTPASASSTNTASSSANSAKVQPPGRTWTSLWRPLSVLIDYAAQQPSFTTYLLCRIDRNLNDLDILDLIQRQTLSYLKPFIKPYYLWHPHLPSLEHIFAEHRKRHTVSSALLLSSMCLVACRHAMPLTDSLPTKLSTLVDQLGTQILLSTPRDMYTVQALELLLAHEPSLVGTSVAGSAQAERGNGLLGESLLAAALTIARGLDLDKALDNVNDICRRPAPSDPAQAQLRRDTLTKHLAGASIWLSLRIWEGHFSFVNSTVRPIDLSYITERAEVMVAIDNDGRKIERMDRDPFLSTEKRFPGLDEDSILRSAGRTGLVYRLKAMARFQDTIAGMYHILATATKPQEITPTSPTPTTPETRQEMLELLSKSSREQLFWQAAKTHAFSPFATVRPALLLEDWATMESYSLQELLPCLAICAFMTGELNRGFSANEMAEALRADQSFCSQSTLISERRDVETHAMLSAFHLFDRGLGYSQPDIMTRGGALTKTQRGALWIEATGAPLLLTTAFATDGCKTFLEKTACGLYGFDHLPFTADMHTVMMITTFHRLRECDRNEYLPPIRPKKSSMPPPSRRMSSLPPDLIDSNDEVVPGRSISQIGVLFIEEMVQVMQKWKLGYSLQRNIPFHFRHILGKSQSQDSQATTKQKNKPASPAAKVAVKRSPKSEPLLNFAKDRKDGAPVHSSSSSSSSSSSKLANHGEGTLSQAQSFSQSFQSSFVSGLDQQPNPTVAAGGHGGMFDIPMFDLFGSASSTDWTNNVPWFDPVVENGGFASGIVSLASFTNGHGTSPWDPYQASPVQPLQNTWPAAAQRQLSSSDTLPRLQYNSASQQAQVPASTQTHAYNYGSGGSASSGGYSGYNLSPQSFANAYPDQNQQHPSASQHYQSHHHQRAYYGGGNHHGGGGGGGR